MPNASKDTRVACRGHGGDGGALRGARRVHRRLRDVPRGRRRDAALQGLPDDRCQSPHWGYVDHGKVTFSYADRDEVYETGDAYYAPPGHVPVVTAGTEIVEFSPTDEYGKTIAVVEQPAALSAST